MNITITNTYTQYILSNPTNKQDVSTVTKEQICQPRYQVFGQVYASERFGIKAVENVRLVSI